MRPSPPLPPWLGRLKAWTAEHSGFTQISRKEWVAIAVLLATVVGFHRRARALQLLRPVSLDPDAVAYLQIASQLDHPWDTAFREPIWPLLLRLWSYIAGSDTSDARLLSVLLGTALIPAAFALGRVVTRRDSAAIMLSALVALHPILIGHSTRALRLELQLLAMTLVVIASVRTSRNESRAWSIAMLATGASALLATNLSGLLFVTVAFVVAAAPTRGRRQVIAAAVTVVLVTAPHLMFNAQRYDDPMFSANNAATFYRNYEYLVIDPQPCPECPDLDELEENSLAGEPATWSSYVFEGRPISEVIERFAMGVTDTTFLRGQEMTTVLGSSSLPVYVAYLVGLGVWVRRRQYALLALLLSSLGGLAFIIPLSIDLRLVLPVSLLALCAVSDGMVSLTAAGGRLIRFVDDPSGSTVHDSDEASAAEVVH